MIRRPAIPTLVAVLLVVAAACGTGTTPAGSRAPTAAATAAPSAPTPTRSPTPDAQALLDDARRSLGALGAIAVLDADGRRTLLRSGVGDEAGAELGDTTRFRIASITKPVVAALVVDAVARGEVELDATVGDLLPGVVRPAPAITVRQLLDHTSGVFDEGNEGDPAADAELLADPALRDEVMDLLASHRAGERVIAPARAIIALAETHDRYFEPGEGYHYSNVNYQLAAMVLETVTGQPLAELLRTRIVEPLGLRHTTLAPPDTGSPEMRGYIRTAVDAAPVDITDDLSWFGNGGNGGILATPGELLAMLRAIVTAKLFPASLVAEMEKPNRASYGLGLATYVLRCGTFYGHAGLVNGTESLALIAPDGSEGVVIALNLVSGHDPGLVSLADAMLCPAG